MINTLIIPSAWNPQNSLFPWIYDLMVPINWKPTINYILENINNWEINKIIILLNINDFKTKDYLDFLNIDKNIKVIVKNIKTKSLWETIYYSKQYIEKNEQIIIQLWDTLYSNNLDFDNDFLLVSKKNIANPDKWEFVDENFNFFDKNITKIEWLYLINGIYFIKNNDSFFNFLKNNTFNFIKSLESYFKQNWGFLKEIKNWYYDLWHLDEYYKSKIDFLRVRSFNSLEYDAFKWIITKKSLNKEKLSWEINWFNKLPNDLKIFTPRLVNYKLWKTVEYSLEFYWYNSLADIFLYSNYSINYLKNIIDKLISYTNYVKSNYNNASFSIWNLKKIYLDKTYSRLDILLNDNFLKELYNKNYLTINWKKYKNIHTLLNKEKINNIIKNNLYKIEDFTIIHWDLCFSNILFDIHNWLFKLIDPRWNFWEIWIWWDIKYDIAKIRHSIHWKYENIISDLFNLDYSIEKNTYNFKYFNWINIELLEYFDKKIIDKWYDIELIKFLEWLLFFTMIPYHSDSKNRQIIMYLTAVILFNETTLLWK